MTAGPVEQARRAAAGSEPVPTDGRAARALRTREAIVDACLAVVEDGDLRPTAPRLAERAGVSVRSVFQHFEDLSALHIAVARRVAERLSVLLVEPDTSLPLDERIAAFVGHRAALLEAITPYRRAADVHGPFAPDIRDAVQQGTAYLRHEVEATFAPELDLLAPDARREVLAALAAGTSWATWNALRAEAGASDAEARAVLTRIIGALLADAGASAVGRRHSAGG